MTVIANTFVADFVIGANETLPILSGRMLDQATQKYVVWTDVQNYQSAAFTLYNGFPFPPTAIWLNQSSHASLALHSDGVSAAFKYTWQAGETNHPGLYGLGLFLVTFSTGVQRFPGGEGEAAFIRIYFPQN